MPAKKAAPSILPLIGAWAFVIGLAIAVLAGLASTAPDAGVITVLAAMGVIIGLLNIRNREIVLYLLASIAFITGAYALSGLINTLLSVVGVNGLRIITMFEYIKALVAPGAAVVALKAIYNVAKER